MPYLWTKVDDARTSPNATISWNDIFGRTIFVDAPTGQDVRYTYGAADRLKQSSRGGAEVNMS